MHLANRFIDKLEFLFVTKSLFFCVLLSFGLTVTSYKAQVSYDAAAAYGLNKINTSYSGSAVKIRRACDNATITIGFNACGNLDTLAINAFAGLQNFPLNSITSAASAAYSLRKINCSYTGAAIRIRSTAAGSPTTNIGFTINGDLDTIAIKAFVGTNSAYVTVWYDQSGNGQDVSQTTVSKQPRMVNTGKIMRQNGRPAINFISGNSTFLYRNVSMVTDEVSVSVIAKINNASARNTLFDLGATNDAGGANTWPDFCIEANTWSTTGSKWGYYANNNSLDGNIATSTNLTSLCITATKTFTASANLIANTNFYVNGASSTFSCRSCVTGVYRSSWPNGFTVGNFNGPYSANFDGFMPELIVFSVALPNTDRKFLEWTQSQYYGITTGIPLGTLPAGTLPAAFIDTWYDQSGGSTHVSQSTLANQPRIVNTGIVEKNNFLPAIFFNGTSQYLSASDVGLPIGNLSISAIVRSNATSYASGVYGSFIHYGAGGAGNAIFGTFGTDANMGTNALAFSQYSDAIGVANSLNASLIYSASRAASNYTLFKNGGSSVSKTMTTNTTLLGANGLTVGMFNASVGGNYLNGYISEISIFPSAISNTRRILIESNRSAATGIAVAVNKYTPPGAGSYNLYVNGIGRQTNSDTVLGTRQTVGMGVKSGRIAATDFLQNNGDYISFGTNCPLGPGTSTLNLPGTIVQRWQNDWYVNKTDVGTTGGNIKIYFDFSDYGYLGGFSPGVVTNYELMYRNSSSGTFAIIAGTTKGVVGDRVEFDVDASAIANGYYTIGTKNTSASPLPIELLSFTAQPNGNQVDINWSTATESNNDYFTIEKSRDGSDFTTLKTVKSKGVNGNSLMQLNYTDIDLNPYEGTSYYRLKQTDFNMTYKYSPIVDVTFDQSLDKDVFVYPNPNNGEFTLNFKGFKTLNTKTQIIIIDALGKKVYEQNLLLSDNLDSYQIIPSEKIAKGFYFMSCTIDGVIYTKKVVVN